jgi:hypothetical protein
MDGYYVTKDAPALEDSWGEQFGGKYVQRGPNEDGVPTARWETDQL